jgi:hypothetical protein
MFFRKKWMMRASHRVRKQRCLFEECVLRILDCLMWSQSDTAKKSSSFLKCDAASLGDNVPTSGRLWCLFNVSHFRLVDLEDYVIAIHAQSSDISHKTWIFVSDCQGKWERVNGFLLELGCIYYLKHLSGGKIYNIYYIDNNYMFRHLSLAIFRLINEKLSKQLYSNCVYCIQCGGKSWSGYEISHLFCRMGGVGTGVLVFCLF